MNTETFTSDAHKQTTRVARRLNGKSTIVDGVITPKSDTFNFDIVDALRNIKSEAMRDSLLNSLAFSADAFINGGLGRLLNEYRQKTEASNIDNPLWATYQEFLQFAQSLDHEQQLLKDMGLDAIDKISTLRHLYGIRMECHRLLADGKMSYETPSLEAFIANPRLRNLSGDSLLKFEDLADDLAEGDKDLKAEILTVAKNKARAESMAALEWDRQRAKVTVLMLQAFKLTDIEHNVDYVDNQPFLQLDPLSQHRMLNGALNSLQRHMVRAATTNTISVVEYAKHRVEAKALRTSIEAAMAHARFDEVLVN